MQLLDSNILIYSGEAEHQSKLLPYVTNPTNAVSLVSRVETLGYSRITPAQIRYFQNLFKVLLVLPFDEAVAERAIELRQQRGLKLGDSLIAATALVHGAELMTRDTADFSKITGLTVINPID